MCVYARTRARARTHTHTQEESSDVAHHLECPEESTGCYSIKHPHAHGRISACRARARPYLPRWARLERQQTRQAWGQQRRQRKRDCCEKAPSGQRWMEALLPQLPAAGAAALPAARAAQLRAQAAAETATARSAAAAWQSGRPEPTSGCRAYRGCPGARRGAARRGSRTPRPWRRAMLPRARSTSEGRQPQSLSTRGAESRRSWASLITAIERIRSQQPVVRDYDQKCGTHKLS